MRNVFENGLKWCEAINLFYFKALAQRWPLKFNQTGDALELVGARLGKNCVNCEWLVPPQKKKKNMEFSFSVVSLIGVISRVWLHFEANFSMFLTQLRFQWIPAARP